MAKKARKGLFTRAQGDMFAKPSPRDARECLDKGSMIHGYGPIHLGMTKREVEEALKTDNPYLTREVEQDSHTRQWTPTGYWKTEVCGVEMFLQVTYDTFPEVAESAGLQGSFESMVRKITLFSPEHNTHAYQAYRNLVEGTDQVVGPDYTKAPSYRGVSSDGGSATAYVRSDNKRSITVRMGASGKRTTIVSIDIESPRIEQGISELVENKRKKALKTASNLFEI